MRRRPGHRLVLAAGGLLLGVQLLMGDSLSPGCSSSSACTDLPAIDLTFEVSGTCSEPGTIRITSGAGVCQLTVTGHPGWRSGFRDTADIQSGRWELAETGSSHGRCKVAPAVAGEHHLDCERLDAAGCSAVLRPVP